MNTGPGQPVSRQVSLAAISSDLNSALPEEYAPDVSRFVTRTLETAPDGSKRRWQSSDQSVILSVEVISTAINGDRICRQAIVRTTTASNGGDFNIRACRLKNGTWAN